MTAQPIPAMLNVELGYKLAEEYENSSMVTLGLQDSYNAPAATASGNPLTSMAVLDRTDPTKPALFSGTAPNSTTVPSGIDQYMNDSSLLFVACAGWVGSAPQGALYDFIAANGGGPKLHEFEAVSIKFSCAVGGVWVYLMASVPGTGMTGIEYLGPQVFSSGSILSGGLYSKDVPYTYGLRPFALVLDLVPATNGMYTPVKMGG